MRIGLVVVMLGLLGAGCAGGGSATGAVPETAALAPADAIAFVTIVTDESSAQWESAERLLGLIPGARDGLVAGVRTQLAAEGLTWDEDVAPALGPEVVVVVTADKRPVLLTQPDSEQALDALVEREDEPVARATIDGWAAVAERDSDLDVYREALTRGTLETDESFTESMAALPDDALVRAWVDTSALTEDLAALLEDAGTGTTTTDLGLDSIGAAITAEDDGVLLTMGIRTPTDAGGTRYEPELFAGVPADAVVALSFGGTQGAVDQLRDAVDLDELSTQVEDLTGVSVEGLFDVLSGEGMIYVRGGGSVPEVTVVLAPPDVDEAWSTVDRLVRTLAEDSGATIEQTSVDGVDASRLRVDDVSVTYARLDDAVIVTSGEEGIADFRSSGEKLVDAAAFTQAAETVELGSTTSGFVYVDIDGLIPLFEGLAGSEALPTDVRDVLQALDSFILEADRDGETTRVSGFVRVNG